MKTNQHSAKRTTRGFTLIEVMVVVVILGILATIVYFSVSSMRDKAKFAKVLSDMDSIRVAIELYRQDNNGKYPPNDNLGDVPPGLGPYLPGGVWPETPWPGAQYDWDNVENIDTVSVNTYDPYGEPPGIINELDDDGISANNVVQLSLRPHCASYDQGTCYISEPYKSAFNFRSSIYYCLRGACRPHPSFLVSEGVLGYCINGQLGISAEICQH
jgi:general secretion pathway protein G